MTSNIDELPSSELTRVKLVLMDIDGTLINGSQFDLDNVRHQLRRLKKYNKEFEFSVATGRTISGARKVLKELDRKEQIRWIIAYNGGVIGKPSASPWIERLAIDAGAYHALLDICRRLSLNVFVYTCTERFDTSQPEQVFIEPTLFFNPATEFNGMPLNRVRDLTRIPVDDVVAILLQDPERSGVIDEVAGQLQKECGALLRVTTSGGQYVEIGHPQSTKSVAMEKLCYRLKIQPSDVMAIGDNFNDLEMLTAAGFGVAVANSPKAVRDATRYVCRNPATAGVAEVLATVAESFRRARGYQRLEKEIE